MKLPTPDTMKKRFWELKAKRDKLREKADPVRAERDKLVAKQLKELEAADKKVAAAEDGLFDLEQEMALLVRLVSASTGSNNMGEPK